MNSTTGSNDSYGWCSRMSCLRIAARMSGRVAQPVGQARHERRILESGRSSTWSISDVSRIRLTGPSQRYRSVVGQLELPQQELRELLRAARRHLEPHGLPELALRQLALRAPGAGSSPPPRRSTGRHRASRGTASSRRSRARGNSSSRCAWMTRRQQDEHVVGAADLPRGSLITRGSTRGALTMAIVVSRPNASRPDSSTMKLSVLLATCGNGCAGSSPIGVSSGRTSRSK